MIADQITRGASATEHAELPTRRLEWVKKPSIRVGRSEAVHHQNHLHPPRQRSEKAIHHRFPAIVALGHVEIEFKARPAERRGGEEGFSKGRSRWSQYH